MYLMGSTRCGISAKQVQRELALRTRPHGACSSRSVRFFRGRYSSWRDRQGRVDETYSGVKRKGHGRPMRGDKKMTPVVGIGQRNGRVVCLRSPKDATA